MILGLDISTSVTGASVINEDGELLFCDAWRTDKKDISTFKKIAMIKKHLLSIKDLYKIRTVFVEEPLMGFKSGFSSAQTISKLQRFNGAICWICNELFKTEPVYIRASSARKLCGIKIKKGQKAKEIVLNYLLDTEDGFDISYTKYGNPAKGSYDMADSIVIAKAGHHKWKKSSKSFHRS